MQLMIMYGVLGILGLVIGSVICQAGPIVDTNYGALQGLTALDRFNQTYDAFYGVPFALPPVDSRRWQIPDDPPESWTGIRNATEFGPHCIQVLGGAYFFMGLGANESEDCLYLNIYIPGSVDEAIESPLPVMVFFYGGAYLFGTSEMYPGEELATTGDVIVVTTTYRISVMGFLSTGDDALPGNNALWDAKAGLEWVNENIAYFGGDTSRITVFGQSAGSGMTGHCMLSPHTNTLFQRAIGISGSVSTVVGYTSDPKRNAQILADLFYCNTTDSYEIVDCLKLIDAKDLDTMGIVAIYMNESRVPNFMPVIDGNFIPQDTRKSYEEGVSGHLDFITGRCADDGAGFALAQPLGAPPFIGPIGNRTRDPNRDNEDITRWFYTILNFYDNPDELYQMLYDHNPNINSTDDEVCSKAGSEVTTDVLFQSGAHYDAIKHAESGGAGATYLYQFMYRQSFLTGYPDWVNGSHLDDMYSVLGDPFMKIIREAYDEPDFSAEDEIVSTNIRAYYTNFAYTGDPNVGPHAVPLTWPQFDPAGARQYLIESVQPWIEEETQELIDEMNWYLYEFWPALRPAWAAPTKETSQETIQHSNEEATEYGMDFSEEDILQAMTSLRETMYSMYNGDEDIMMTIDDRIISAFESREQYRKLRQNGDMYQ